MQADTILSCIPKITSVKYLICPTTAVQKDVLSVKNGSQKSLFTNHTQFAHTYEYTFVFVRLVSVTDVVAVATTITIRC